MTLLLVGLAVAAAIVLIARVVRRRGPTTIVIQEPALGVLNLAADADPALLTRDLELIAPLFRRTLNSETDPPRCDVLLLYCDIESNGVVKGSARNLREIVRDSGASIVVVATNHPVDVYIAAAPKLPFGQANLVMTLDRKGEALPTFLSKLFRR